jgi:hypothetical protein
MGLLVIPGASCTEVSSYLVTRPYRGLSLLAVTAALPDRVSPAWSTRGSYAQPNANDLLSGYTNTQAVAMAGWTKMLELGGTWRLWQIRLLTSVVHVGECSSTNVYLCNSSGRSRGSAHSPAC